MKKLFFLLSINLLLFSCKEETVQELILYIKNDSDQALSVKVFPKVKYRENAHLYKMGVGNGFLSCEFSLDSLMQRELFYSSNILLEPHTLAQEVFDSIKVVPANISSVSIKFSPSAVIGYDENLFSSSGYWTYEIRNQDLATMFRSNPHEFHEYTFHISSIAVAALITGN